MDKRHYQTKRLNDGITVSARTISDGTDRRYIIWCLIAVLIFGTIFHWEQSLLRELKQNPLGVFILSIIVLRALFKLFWQIFGCENISIRNGILTHSYTLFAIGRRRRFPLNEISDWQFRENSPKAFIEGRRIRTMIVRKNRRNYKYHTEWSSNLNQPISLPSIFSIRKSKWGAWSFDYRGETILIGEFFDSKDSRLIDAELRNFLLSRVKRRISAVRAETRSDDL